MINCFFCVESNYRKIMFPTYAEFMRPLAVMVVVFALLALDLTKNDGYWFSRVNDTWNEISRHASLR